MPTVRTFSYVVLSTFMEMLLLNSAKLFASLYSPVCSLLTIMQMSSSFSGIIPLNKGLEFDSSSSSNKKLRLEICKLLLDTEAEPAMFKTPVIVAPE